MSVDQQTEQGLEENIIELMRLLVAQSPDSAVAVSTGLFVSTVEHRIAMGGGDNQQEIKIDGQDNRDITLHEVKA